MPQNQGPVVLQVQRPMGALGIFGSNALGQLGAGLGQAAGGFLSDLINPDPRKALIESQADAQNQKNDQDMLGAWEEYQKARGKIGDANEARDFFSSRTNDEDHVDRLVRLGTPTQANEEYKIAGDAMGVLRKEDEVKPFAPTKQGAFATVPPPPSAEKPGPTLPAADVAPATSSAISTEADSSASPGPSAQLEQATKDVMSVTPEVITDTTKEVKPVLPPESLPPVEQAQQPIAISQDAKIGAQRKLMQVQGRLAMLGQMAVVQKTGMIDPAQRNIALASIATTDRDIADVINIGRIAQGEDPIGLNKNYRQMAFYGMARELLNNAAWRSRATPDQISRFEDYAKQYENTYMNDQNWTGTDWGYVDSLKTKLLPQAVGNGGILQFMTMQDQHEHQVSEAAKARAARASEFQATHGLAARQMNLAEAEFGKRSGMMDEQIRAMHLSNEEAASLQGTKLQEFQLRMSQIKQQMSQDKSLMRMKLDGASISNLAAIQALSETSLNQAIQITGMTIQDEQRRAVAASTALDRVQQQQQKLTAAWNNTDKSSLAMNAVQQYQNKPSKYANDYNGMTTDKRAAVDALAQELAGEGNTPNSVVKAQAMVGVNQPDYAQYLLQYNKYAKQATAFSQQIADMAKEDNSIGDRIKALQSQLGGDQAAQAKGQYQELVNTYLNANVLRVKTELATRGIRGVPTEQARDFIKNNPTLIPYMLGQASVAQGKINTSGSASSLTTDQVASLFGLSREVRGADGSALTLDAFSKLTAHGQTLKQALGKNLPSAYNTYVLFLRGGF